MISVVKKYALLAIAFGAFGSVFGASALSDSSLEAKKAEIVRLVASLGDEKKFFEERIVPTLLRNLSNRKYGEFIFRLVAEPTSIDIKTLRDLAKTRLEFAKKIQKQALALSLPSLSIYGFMGDADCLKLEGIWRRDLDHIVTVVGHAVEKCREVTAILANVDSLSALSSYNLEEIESDWVAAINTAEVLFGALKDTFTLFQKGVDAASSKPCEKCSKKPKGAEVFSLCGRCKRVFYCSRECQRKDWKKHQLHCTSV